jgi:hypothetical protein
VPNTLVHFAVQTAASRSVWRRLDPRFIFLGCLLPDVPWILRRVIVGFGVPVDPFDIRLYTMAQASLAGTLLLAGAFSVLTRAPRLVFTVLGANALLHLLLDATEIKWGNGVHLGAPFSWRMTAFEWVSGDSVVVPALALAGALVASWEILRPPLPAIGFASSRARLLAAAGLLAAYFAAPLLVLDAVYASDSYSVKTVREREARPGRRIGLDRTIFHASPAGAGEIELWTGERVRAEGTLPTHDARVSLLGTFLAPDRLRVDRLTVHEGSRDWPTYLGLGLLVLVWVRPLVRPVTAAGAGCL